jgi:DNA ligase-1
MIIFKKDTKNNTRYLEIIAVGNKIIQRSGIIGTVNEVEHVKEAKPKNVGKKNETSAESQAELEVASIITSKLKEGYFTSIKEAENEIVILPMLAKNFNDEKHKIDWTNCYIQNKYDGMRCLAHVKANGQVSLISRDGRIIENMQHIINELFLIKKDIIFDGELYAHGLSFQENMKLIKKYRKGETENIKYHIYDVVSDDSYKNRESVIDNIGIDSFKYCEKVLTLPITSFADLKEIHAINLKNGYEGSIIRHSNDGYKCNGRSSSLLKYKDFQDIDAKIIDIVPAEQRPEWGVPVLEYNDKVFRAGLKYPHEDRKEFLTNKHKYIGQTAVIRFFEWTDDGVPRFPIMVGIRLDNLIK